MPVSVHVKNWVAWKHMRLSSWPSDWLSDGLNGLWTQSACQSARHQRHNVKNWRWRKRARWRYVYTDLLNKMCPAVSPVHCECSLETELYFGQPPAFEARNLVSIICHYCPSLSSLLLFHIAGLGLGFGGFSLWLQLWHVECSHCTDPDSDLNPNGCIGNPSPHPPMRISH